MKKILNFKSIFLFLLAGTFTMACEENQDVVTADAQEGAFITVAGSSGTLAGSPDGTVALEDAVIEFSDAELLYVAKPIDAENAAMIEELVVVKRFAGQEVEIARGNPTDGVTVEYTSLDDFLAGFEGVAADDLRVGNVIEFQTLIRMKDGRVLTNGTASALAINISCASDLTGTYTVTNSWCSPSFTIEITRNADGSYYLPVADGGGLHKCTTNSTLLNWGTIVEQCGEILPTGQVRFAELSGNNIGNITGGTWNAETGTLTMKHTQSFTPNWPAEWTSTYVRQ